MSLVDKINPQEHSDYFLLHTIISLLDVAVGNHDLPWNEKVRRFKVIDCLVFHLLRIRSGSDCVTSILTYLKNAILWKKQILRNV